MSSERSGYFAGAASTYRKTDEQRDRNMIEQPSESVVRIAPEAGESTFRDKAQLDGEVGGI